MHRLYYSPGACSLAPHIALEEIGAPYELELISSAGGEMTDTTRWRAVNPKGRVPALTDVAGRIGGTDGLLTEAPAILVYLARSHPEAGLLPGDRAGEARALEWMNWLSGNVHAMTFGLLWRPQRFADDPDLFPALQAKGRKSLVEQYEYIESLLADGRDWSVPGGYSVVDPYLLVFYHWGGRFDLDMATDYPAWARLTLRTTARPAVGRVLEHENLTIR